MKSKGAGARKYGAKASKKVERAMHEMKRGELRSGRSAKSVTGKKQAIAIGLSEARREGAKVPPPPARAAARGRKKATKRTPAKSPARTTPAAGKTRRRSPAARSDSTAARG